MFYPFVDKHEELCMQLDRSRLLLKPQQEELHVYTADVKWLMNSIARVQIKIKNAENDMYHQVYDPSLSSYAKQPVPDYMAEFRIEPVVENDLIPETLIITKESFLPDIVQAVVVTYSQTKQNTDQCRVEVRDVALPVEKVYTLPQIIPLPHNVQSYRWDIIPVEKQARPSSANSNYSYTSQGSLYSVYS